MITIRTALFAAPLAALLCAAGCGKTPPALPTEQVNLAADTTNLFIAPPAALPGGSPTAIVATVNGAAITRAQVDQEMQAFLAQAGGRLPPERMAQILPQMEERARDNLITRELLVQAVATEKVEATPADIDAAIEQMKQSAPPGLTLEGMLARNNMTMEVFRERLAGDLRINKLLDAQASNRTTVAEADVKQFYEQNIQEFTQAEQVRASHILVKVEETDTDEQKKAKREKLEKLRQSIVDGADFAQVASAESDCPSKARGGDLGDFGRGMMAPPFEEAAFSQKVGDLGPVFETVFGYHIVKVASHQEGKVTPFEEVKERLYSHLAAKAYVDGLRKAAKIELNKGS